MPDTVQMLGEWMGMSRTWLSVEWGKCYFMEITFMEGYQGGQQVQGKVLSGGHPASRLPGVSGHD